MIVLYILLGILFIITFVMLSKVTAFIRMVDNEIYLKIGAYGIYYWILNPSNKTDESEQSKKKDNSQADKDNQNHNKNNEKLSKKKQEIRKSKNSLLDIIKNEDGKIDPKKAISVLSNICRVVFPMVKNITKKTKITNFKILMTIGACDAHKTAIEYANISNTIQIIVGYLKTLKFVKIKQIELYPDFVRGEVQYDISFFIKTRVWTIVFEALKASVIFIFNKSKSKDKKGSVENVIRKSSKRPNGQRNG